ncbi:MAG: hypothetical protein R6U42_04725 [Halomonas sp.]
MKAKLQLIVLIVVLGAPVPVAWAMLHWQVGIPQTDVARGELDHQLPPLNQWPLEWQASNERWSLVWSAPEDCITECQAQADQWWRMHRALGRKAARVERLRLSEQQQKVLPGEASLQWQGSPPIWVEDFQVWLVDPQGIVVTRYAALPDIEDVHQDLARLLKRNPE